MAGQRGEVRGRGERGETLAGSARQPITVDKQRRYVAVPTLLLSSCPQFGACALRTSLRFLAFHLPLSALLSCFLSSPTGSLSSPTGSLSSPTASLSLPSGKVMKPLGEGKRSVVATGCNASTPIHRN